MEKYWPAAMAVTPLRPPGTLLSPQPLIPQATTVPSAFSATVKLWPAATAVTPLSPTGTVVWPEEFEPQACTVMLRGSAKLGASFTAVKVIVTVAASEESAPSDALTVKVFAPFSLAAGT